MNEKWIEVAEKPCVHISDLPERRLETVIPDASAQSQARSLGIMPPHLCLDVNFYDYRPGYRYNSTRDEFFLNCIGLRNEHELYLDGKFKVVLNRYIYPDISTGTSEPFRRNYFDWHDPISAIVTVEKFVGSHFFLTEYGYICRIRNYSILKDDYAEATSPEAIAKSRIRELILL